MPKRAKQRIKKTTFVRQARPEISPMCNEYRRKIYQTMAVSFFKGYYQALLRLIDRKVICGCFYLHIMLAIYAWFFASFIIFKNRYYIKKVPGFFFFISTEIGFTN